MPLDPNSERTVKRALRAMIRDMKRKDPGPDATVEELITAAQVPVPRPPELDEKPSKESPYVA